MRALMVAAAFPALASTTKCSWTDTASGSTWNLDPLVARDHYNFRGISGSQDSLHAGGASTGVYHYEDYTYLCVVPCRLWSQPQRTLSFAG